RTPQPGRLPEVCAAGSARHEGHHCLDLRVRAQPVGRILWQVPALHGNGAHQRIRIVGRRLGHARVEGACGRRAGLGGLLVPEHRRGGTDVVGVESALVLVEHEGRLVIHRSVEADARRGSVVGSKLPTGATGRARRAAGAVNAHVRPRFCSVTVQAAQATRPGSGRAALRELAKEMAEAKIAAANSGRSSYSSTTASFSDWLSSRPYGANRASERLL